MDPKRILIVEADNNFALSLAAVLQGAGFASSIAASAAEAQRELRERRPSLVLLRAELPDLSGFALCGRLRKEKSSQGLPIVLLSSEATPEALAEHRSHPASAADGYLAIPFPMEELLGQVQELIALSAEEGPVEEAQELFEPPVAPSDEDIEGALAGALGGDSIPDAPHAQSGLEAMTPPPPPRPPRLPKRPRRSSLTEEDRTFLDRVFESIADRRTELLAESHSARRPAVKRELLATPEGKLQVLREELNRRESQVARLSEIWTIRERELTSIDDKLHEKEVEIQGLKMQVDDLLRRLADAREFFVKKDQEHGQVVDSMLLDKFINEKELIEVVASKEKDIAVLRRDLRTREEELARRLGELDQGREEIARLEKARSVELLQFELRERQLSALLARREVEILGRGSDFDEAVDLASDLGSQLRLERDEATRALREASRERGLAEVAGDHATRELTIALEAERARGGLFELDAAQRLRAHEEVEADLRLLLDEADEQLSLLLLESERLRVQRDGLQQSLSSRLADREAALAQLGADLATEHEEAVAREAQLSAEVATRVEQLGNLEGEIEALRHEKAEREQELQAALDEAQTQIAALTRQGEQLASDLTASNDRGQALDAELSATRAEAQRQLEEARAAHEALRLDRDGRLQAAASELAELRGQLTGELEATQGELGRTQVELSETQAEKARREDELSRSLAEKIEQAGALEGELGAVRAHAAQRDEELTGEIAAARAEGERLQGQLEQVGMEKARSEGEMSAQLQAAGERLAERENDIANFQRLRTELAGEFEATQAEVARLTQVLSELEAAKAEVEATSAAQLADLQRLLAETQGELSAAGQEQNRLLAEIEELKARAEARAAELKGEIASGEQALRESEERFQGQLDEAQGRQEQLEAALAASGKSFADEQRKVAATQAAAQKREEAVQREAVVKAEAARAAEQRLQKLLDEAGAQGKGLQQSLAELSQVERRLRDELAAQVAAGANLTARAEKLTGERDAQKREAVAAVTARDAKISELQSAVAAAQQERRRLEDEGTAKLQKSEAAAKELQARLAESQAGRERADREAQQTLAARAKRAQELEQAVEAAAAGKARAERELGQRAQLAEAKAAEAAQKLASAQRLQKDLEGRLAKEGQEAQAKHKAELERREAQRAQEVARLQQALQEKSKAVKMMELELQRLKTRGAGAAPTAPTARRIPDTTQPNVATSAVQGSPLSDDLDDMPTKVMERPKIAPAAARPAPAAPAPESKAEEDDLDSMLSKLEM